MAQPLGGALSGRAGVLIGNWLWCRAETALKIRWRRLRIGQIVDFGKQRLLAQCGCHTLRAQSRAQAP
jgi:hypothetical protein